MAITPTPARNSILTCSPPSWSTAPSSPSTIRSTSSKARFVSSSSRCCAPTSSVPLVSCTPSAGLSIFLMKAPGFSNSGSALPAAPRGSFLWFARAAASRAFVKCFGNWSAPSFPTPSCPRPNGNRRPSLRPDNRPARVPSAQRLIVGQRVVSKRHDYEEDRQHFAVTEIHIGHAFHQKREHHRDASVQKESAVVPARGEGAQPSPEIPQNLADQPEKDQ